MSCPPELTWSVYVDGELEPAEAREVEVHLVGCQACRTAVQALRDEGVLLSDALLGREPRSFRRASPQRARGLAIGVVPSLGVLAAMAAVVSWLLETRMPASVSWLNPLNLIGAYEMLLDAVFMFRSEAPALFQLGVAVGTTVGVSVLLSYALSIVVRRLMGPTALGLLLLVLQGLVAPPAADALVVRDEEAIRIERDEMLSQSMIASAESIHVEGVVEGDLIVTTKRLVVRGEVRGNIYAFVEELDLLGRVTGSVHAGCDRCIIAGVIDGSYWGAGDDLSLREGARVGRDVSVIQGDVVVDGVIERDLVVISGDVELRGAVGRDVFTHAGQVSVLDGARIGGDLHVEVRGDEQPSVDEGATIAGELIREQIEHGVTDDHWGALTIAFWVRALILMTAMFIVGMAMHAVVPWVFDNHLETPGAFFRSLGYGFALLIGAPVAILLTCLTIVGIPIAIIAFWVFLTVLFVSGIVVGALIGSAIFQLDEGETTGFGLALLVGLAVLQLSTVIPWVGPLLHVLIMLTGMGLIVERCIGAFFTRRALAVSR